MKGDHLGELEELVLLSLRAVAGEGSTLEIQRVLEEEADRPLSLGAVYAALDRLERKGLASSELGDPTPVQGGRRKRLYSVTAEGLKALLAKRAMRRTLWAKAIEGGADAEGSGHPLPSLPEGSTP